MAKAKDADTAPMGVQELVEAFKELVLAEKQEALTAMQDALAADISARRAQLMAELSALGGHMEAPKPTRTRAPREEGDARLTVKPMYRAPDGYEWSGRGALPKVFKALGVTDKAGMEQFRITD
jgi:DNA-binding protein H-NS